MPPPAPAVTYGQEAPSYAPGQPLPPPSPGIDSAQWLKPPTRLVPAILATLCCFLPTGIVALIYASKVSPAWDRGDAEEARRASSRATLWCVISLVGGLIWGVFGTLWTLLVN